MIVLALKAWTFIQSPIGRYALGALAIIAALFALYSAGVHAGEKHERGVWQAAQAKAEAKARTVEKKSDAITSDVSTKLETTKTEIRWRTRVQLQEVTRYVPVESDRACIVGVGALRLHEHTLTGGAGLPEAPGRLVEADSGVHLSEIVADDVAFAGTAYEWKAEAVAWRRWYSAHADLWSKNYGAAKSP